MVVAVAVLSAIAAALLAATVRPLVSWQSLMRRRVVVVLDTERSIAGVLVRRRGGLLVLAQASTSQGDRTVGFDGEVVVERARIQWMQVLR